MHGCTRGRVWCANALGCSRGSSVSAVTAKESGFDCGEPWSTPSPLGVSGPRTRSACARRGTCHSRWDSSSNPRSKSSSSRRKSCCSSKREQPCHSDSERSSWPPSIWPWSGTRGRLERARLGPTRWRNPSRRGIDARCWRPLLRRQNRSRMWGRSGRFRRRRELHCGVPRVRGTGAVRHGEAGSGGRTHMRGVEHGATRCWGYNNYGQLGLGHTESIGDQEFEMPAPDVPLNESVKHVAVASAGAHSCAVLETGAVRCWGHNNVGQLGLGHTDTIGDDETPRTDVDLDEPAAQVALGVVHTCALLVSGAVRCWGANSLVGFTTSEAIGDTETPTQNVPLDEKALQITAGVQHTCALLESGKVRCWGAAGDHQLGIIGAQDMDPSVLPTIDVEILVTAVSIAAGGYASCALVAEYGDSLQCLTTSGEVRCWGLAEYAGFGKEGVIASAIQSDKHAGELVATMPPPAVELGEAAVSRRHGGHVRHSPERQPALLGERKHGLRRHLVRR